MLGEQALAPLPIWSFGVLVVLTTAAAVVDLELKRVPNWLTYPAILIALVGHTVIGLRGDVGWAGLLDSVTGLLIGFLPLGICWWAGGIGGGDAKLAGAIGALAGWRFAFTALTYGIGVAALMAVFVMIQKRMVRRTLRRVWLALQLLLWKQKPANPSTPDSPTVPFAVALCVGTLAALLELVIRHWAGPDVGTGVSKFFLGG